MTFRSHTEVAPCTADADVLGAYALTHELGSGLLTRIHAVARVTDGSSWTLKRLQPEHAEDAQARALLLAAGRSLLGVSAPFLVGVREVHEQPEVYLILERVDGVDLAALLAQLPPRDAARFALPVLIDALHGLQTLHTLPGPKGEVAGLVHGAPHERHILVGTDGRGRVIDMTHAVGPGMPWSAARDGRLEPRLVAPEQVLAPAHIDARADLYVLGSVLWQALTGRPLARSVGEDGAPRALLSHTPPAPSEVGASWGRGLDRVCACALERTRSRRFRSAADMAAALRDEAERSVPLASPDEIAALVRSLGGRRSPEAAQLAARVTLLGVGGREPAAGARRARTPEAQPRRSTPQPSPAVAPEATGAQVLAVAPEPAATTSGTAPTTQLEFPAPAASARASTTSRVSQLSTRPRWEEPSPSLPPRPRARRASAFKYALMGLALALPALGLSLGSAVQTDQVRAALSRRLDAVVGGRDAAGSMPPALERSVVTRPASAPPTLPPEQARPGSAEAENEEDAQSRRAAPTQRAAVAPAAGARAGARRASKSGAVTRAPERAADVVASNALAQPERKTGEDDAPPMASEEGLREPVPANPY